MSDSYTLLDAAYAAARWGWYLTAFLVLGAGSYAPFLFRLRTGLHATDPDIAVELSRRAARIGLAAAAGLLLFSCLRLYLQSRTLIEPGEPVSADVIRAVIGTTWGRGWIRQAALGLLAGVAFLAARSNSRFGWMVASAAGGGLGVAAGMTGHAATPQSGPGGLLLDAAHVWAGGFWIGGLAVMLMAGLGACRGLTDEPRRIMLRAMVADFSRRAMVFAPVTIGLGLWLSARYLGWSWPLHLSGNGAYGWTLVAKLGIVLVVGLLGAYNWRVAQPGLRHAGGERRFRTSARFETLLGVLVLAVTAVLVALPLPGEHS